MVELEKLFSDILHTTENPAVFENIFITKEGKEIKRVKKVEKFDLTSNDLLSELRKGQEKDIDFYQKGVKKIFKKYNFKGIINELSNLEKKEHFFVTNSSISELMLKINQESFSDIFEFNHIVVDDRLEDEIIVGEKLNKCVLNKETGEYYIDTDSLVILNLK